jgi:hypothetical protein
MTLLEHAIGYAKRGALVFPLNADKTPATERGFYDGTTEPATIEAWWQRNPNSLIGVRIPADIVVLDIDPRHGGDVVWRAMEQAYGTIDIGRQHHSGRNDGGFHAWFKHPGGKLSTKAITEWAERNGVASYTDKGKPTCGIDILHHEYRYSILPPSPHPATGQPYEWDNQGKPGVMPPWLAAMLEPPAPAPPKPQRPRLDTDGDSIADWYTETARWSDILDGWTIAHGDGETDGSKWKHPTATASWSATIRHGCLFVYTPNTDFDETEPSSPNGYTKFKAYAVTRHNGDMSEAARELRAIKDGPRETINLDVKAPAERPPADEPWPDPVPLQGQRECPPFPIHVLPDWMAAQARQVGEEMQYPPDLPAQLAITAASIALSKRVTVQVDGPWVEGTNIYTVTAMPASAGKSPAFKHMLGPINDFEADLIEASAKDIQDREIRRKMIEKDIADAIKATDQNRASTFSDELRELPPIPTPRLIAEDVTPEKLAMLMAEQDGRMALVSTEGGLFQIMAGRYTDTSNLDIFLQAWSGDRVTQDRVGRESLVIRDARLVVGLTVQPLVIEQIGENGEFSGRGMLARFMYSIPPSTVGKRDKRRRSTWNQTIADRYNDELRRMVNRFHKGDCLPQLRLSDEAHDVFVDWQQGHEDRMGYNGDLEHLAEWVSKMHSTVCRLAAIIHMAEREAPPNGPMPDEIPVDVMLRAIVIGDYWEAHAKIAGDLWGADPEIAKAVRLLKWAEARREVDGDVFTIREAMRGLRKLFPKAEAAIPALQILTESGWIRADMPAVEWGRGRGGQSAMFTLRPLATTESATCGQVVTHVTHVPKGESKITHSLITGMDGWAPRDMRDMGDNLTTEPDLATTTESSESEPKPTSKPAPRHPIVPDAF